jgi:hypothetical protein
MSDWAIDAVVIDASGRRRSPAGRRSRPAATYLVLDTAEDPYVSENPLAISTSRCHPDRPCCSTPTASWRPVLTGPQLSASQRFEFFSPSGSGCRPPELAQPVAELRPDDDVALLASTTERPSADEVR